MLDFGNVVAHLVSAGARVPFAYDPDIHVTSVGYLDSSDTSSESSHIQVGYASTFYRLGANAHPGLYVLATDIAAEEIQPPRPGCHLILVENTDDLAHLVEDLQLLVRQSGSAGSLDRLMRILLDRDDLPALAECASEVLRNPVIVCDASYNIVAHSEYHGTADAVWRTGLTRGYLTFEFIAKLRGQDTNYFETDASRVSTIVERISPHRRLMHKLIYGGSFVGYLLVLELESALEETSTTLYRQVAEILAKQMASEKAIAGQFHTHRSREVNLLLDLMSNRVVSRRMFDELVGQTSFAAEQSYVVLALDLRLELMDNVVQDSLRQRINEMVPDCYAVFRDSWVLVLVCMPKDAALSRASIAPGGAQVRIGATISKYMHPVRAFLEESDLRGGLSEPFSDLYDLPWHVEQAEQSVRVAESLSRVQSERLEYLGDGGQLSKTRFGGAAILNPVPYDRVRFDHLLAYVPEHRRLWFVSPEVRHLIAEEGVDSELFETLDTYLSHASSLARTAEACFVHRNTVKYRLETLRQKYGIDVDDDAGFYDLAMSVAIARRSSGY